MDDIYKKVGEFNPNRKQKILVVFDDMIAAMLSNKRLNAIVTNLFITRRKLNISHVFITKSYFTVPKNIRLISTHYFVTKFQTKENFNKLRLIFHQILVFNTL